MQRLADSWFPALLGASCLLLALWQLGVRLRPSYVPVAVDQPALTVSVGGAVVRPGLYELPWGSRVADLVTAAGGLAAGAAADMVQSALPLGQGDTVFIPHAAAPDGGGRVSLNSADSWTLQQLPGIGPALAERIIGGRPYSTVQDLLSVSGIGPATLARLERLVSP